jgi:hypothetical protein
MEVLTSKKRLVAGSSQAGHAAVDVWRADLMSILDEAKAQGRIRVAIMLLTDLNQMFRFAVQRELVSKNPLDGIRRADVGGRDGA